MKMIARAGDLRRALRIAGAAVERRNTIPILSCVRLTVAAGRVTIEGTDLDVAVTAPAPLVSGEDGRLCLPAHRLAALLRLLPADEMISVTAKGDRAQIDLGSGRISMIAPPASDFPSMAERVVTAEAEMDGARLGSILRRIAPFVSEEETRYYLNGICLHAQSGEMVAVATNGHILALIRTPFAGDFLGAERLILPRGAVRILAPRLGDAPVKVELLAPMEGQTVARMRFTTPDFSLETKLIDGKFPDYERVIPTDQWVRLVGDRRALDRAILRLAVLWPDDPYRSGAIYSGTDDRIAISAGNDDEFGVLAAPLRYGAGGRKDFRIAANLRNLMKATGAARDGEIAIGIKDERSPIGITDGDGSIFVVMPLRSSAPRPELPEGVAA